MQKPHACLRCPSYGTGHGFLQQIVSHKEKAIGKDSQPLVHVIGPRPYKKNDNCYVEQKNFTHVRELFGYERFEDDELTELMNDIYQNYWNPLQNFFIPTMKIKEKVRIGGVVHKKYDQPKTPFQRVNESKVLTPNQEEELRLKRNQMDPFKLKLGLEQKLNSFYEIIRNQNIRKAA